MGTRVRLSVLVLLALVLGLTGTARAGGSTSFALQSSFPGATGSFFGYAVAVDGTTAVVGALDDDGMKGAAYVYVLTGSTWTKQQVLTAPDGLAGDQLGYDVAISGNTAMVGAAGKANGQGYVYVFTLTGTTWVLQTELTSQDGAANDCFGCSIALQGTTAFVGASGKTNGAGGVYELTGSGASWQQGQTFAGASGEAFGFSVALSSDAKTAVVGAFEGSSATGHAYVLALSGSTWSRQAVLAASDGKAGDAFGYAVAVDGTTALVGAYGANAAEGAVYVFASAAGAWSQQPKLLASDGAPNDHFGYSVALSGTTALVGAYEKSATTGAAYVFTNSGASWSQQELSGQEAGASFGYAVAVSPSAAVIGAFSASNDSGAVSMFAPTLVNPAPAVGPVGVALLSLLLLGAALRMSRRSRAGVLVSLLLGVAACSGGPDAASGGGATSASGRVVSPEDMGSVGMDLVLSGGEQVNVVDWTITGPDGGDAVVQSSQVKVDALSVQFLVGSIPAGSDYRVTLSGTTADGGVVCAGAAQFDVAARATTLVSVQMACTANGAGSTGTSVNGSSFNCAAWGSVAASPLETKVGSSVVVSATANGPEPAQLTYAWSSPTGTFSAARSATSSFTCAHVGAAVLTVTVGDGPVPSGSTCNPTLDTTTITITCDAGTAPPAPAMPPWALALLVAALAAIGVTSTKRGFLLSQRTSLRSSQ